MQCRNAVRSTADGYPSLQARSVARQRPRVRSAVPAARSSEALLFELLLQLGEAPAADKADRSRRKAKLFGNFVIGPRRGFEEKHLDHALAALRHFGDYVAQQLLLFELYQHLLR